MIVFELRLVGHHQQTTRFQIEIERPARHVLPANRHPARGAERNQSDRLADGEFTQRVVVRSYAVRPVTVQIEPDAVERGAARTLDPRQHSR